jgi:hypothetical protein
MMIDYKGNESSILIATRMIAALNPDDRFNKQKTFLEHFNIYLDRGPTSREKIISFLDFNPQYDIRVGRIVRWTIRNSGVLLLAIILWAGYRWLSGRSQRTQARQQERDAAGAALRNGGASRSGLGLSGEKPPSLAEPEKPVLPDPVGGNKSVAKRSR